MTWNDQPASEPAQQPPASTASSRRRRRRDAPATGVRRDPPDRRDRGSSPSACSSSAERPSSSRPIPRPRRRRAATTQPSGGATAPSGRPGADDRPPRDPHRLDEGLPEHGRLGSGGSNGSGGSTAPSTTAPSSSPELYHATAARLGGPPARLRGCSVDARRGRLLGVVGAGRQPALTPGSAGGRRRLVLALADLEQVAVRVAEERPDLPRVFDRIGEEARAAGDELGVRRPAVGDRDDQLGAGAGPDRPAAPSSRSACRPSARRRSRAAATSRRTGPPPTSRRTRRRSRPRGRRDTRRPTGRGRRRRAGGSGRWHRRGRRRISAIIADSGRTVVGRAGARGSALDGARPPRPPPFRTGPRQSRAIRCRPPTGGWSLTS